MPKKWGRIWAGCLLSGWLFAGCVAPPFYSYLVYENPTSFVRLEVSPWVDPDLPQTWNEHPASISNQQMVEALSGLRVREYRSGPIRWFRGLADPKPAFFKAEIELLAPRLLEGLGLAVPQELVTFYISHPVNATKREVTSGGMYVKGGNLHVIISNHRTNYEIPPAGLIYDRRYPLFSIAPLDVDLLYETEEMVLPKEERFWEAFLGDEHSGKIVLDLSRLSMMQM
ncbi:MAG TPA: hypothetical protein PKK23_03335 [Nitrospirales bacterium]|nr:hypothetical protein [Nitrospiraceae bacterium]HNP28049.1 hypothetical protein [Nitrospirales bacterium]